MYGASRGTVREPGHSLQATRLPATSITKRYLTAQQGRQGHGRTRGGGAGRQHGKAEVRQGALGTWMHVCMHRQMCPLWPAACTPVGTSPGIPCRPIQPAFQPAFQPALPPLPSFFTRRSIASLTWSIWIVSQSQVMLCSAAKSAAAWGGGQGPGRWAGTAGRRAGWFKAGCSPQFPQNGHASPPVVPCSARARQARGRQGPS